MNNITISNMVIIRSFKLDEKKEYLPSKLSKSKLSIVIKI